MTRKLDSMKYSNIFSRLYHASQYSLDGLIHALRHEQAFRQEAGTLALLCGVILWLDVPAFRAVLLIGAWLMVMCFELVNSAVEKAFDLIDENFRPEIKAGKDMLSLSVGIMIFFNVILWAVLICDNIG